MPEDVITSIIAEAVADAEGGEANAPDTPTDTPAVAADAEPSTGSGVADTAPVADKVDAPAAVDLSEVEKLLDSAGIKPPVEGQRENRLPYSRVKKIVENFEKKLTTSHTAALQERETKIAAADKELQVFRAADHLIKTDPDRYIKMLATILPEKYSRFANPAAAPVTSPAAPAASPLGARPAPDVTFTDGSTGYSPEQHDKLLDWVARTAEANAIKSFELKLAPFEQDRQASEARKRVDALNAENLPKIQARIQHMSKTYGKLFDEDYAKGNSSETLKLIKERGLSMEAACAEIFVPKLRADETTLRASIIKELNARPKAASSGSPAATTDTADAGPLSTEDIIRRAIAPLKGR